MPFCAEALRAFHCKPLGTSLLFSQSVGLTPRTGFFEGDISATHLLSHIVCLQREGRVVNGLSFLKLRHQWTDPKQMDKGPPGLGTLTLPRILPASNTSIYSVPGPPMSILLSFFLWKLTAWSLQFKGRHTKKCVREQM